MEQAPRVSFLIFTPSWCVEIGVETLFIIYANDV